MRSKASETRESAQVTKVQYWEKSQHEHAFHRKTRRRQRASKESEKGGGSGVERSVSGRLAGGREGEVAYQKVLKFSLKIGN